MSGRSLALLAEQVVFSSRTLVLLGVLALGTDAAQFGTLGLACAANQLIVGLYSAAIIDQLLVSRTRLRHPGPTLGLVAVSGSVLLGLLGYLANGIAMALVVASVVPSVIVETFRVHSTQRAPIVSLLAGATVPCSVALTAVLMPGDVTAILADYFVAITVVAGLYSFIGSADTDGTRLRDAVQPRRSLLFAGDFVLSAGYGQVLVLTAVVVLPAYDLASFRLAQSAFAFCAIALLGFRGPLLMSPEETHPNRVRYREVLLAAHVVAALSAISIGFGLAMFASLASGLSTELIGDITPPLSIQAALLPTSVLAPLELKRRGEGRKIFVLRACTVGVSLIAVAGGVLLMGTVGLAWGLLLGTLFGVFLWNFVVR